ncbi:Transketolase 1 [Legionella massiliensis]|uniref:Transketolase 1 n=1 Tax=Legionella massiliensis TaxID=1034943 RepID=A0A078KTD5_9GAMM|nr:transketolase [Legionella massiliensis]CDZ76222.1 Transketolase 1 [Legionella massiliensis]CEE11960.1 Transketolase 1 [Legionella massiliensis]
MDIQKTKTLAKQIRKHSLQMVARSKSSHVGCCLSIADILAVLYEEILRYDTANPENSSRDRFILSKGHATAVLYATLAEKGFFPKDWLESYNFHGAKLLGHCTSHNVPGVELSTGSLGHGLSVGLGMAQALKIDKLDYKVYVLVGDGECNEGSIWEAALLARQLKLDNLCLIIDYNKIQSFGFVEEVIDLSNLAAKWSSFGWEVFDIDGHDHRELYKAFSSQNHEKKPKVIIANTIKGKGVSYMENKLEWHYKSPNPEQLQIAIEEVEAML